MPPGKRLVVAAEGVLALRDLALDQPVTDAHAEAAHGAALGQRELVDGLDGTRLGVDEALGERDLRPSADDPGLHIHADQRHRLAVGGDKAEQVLDDGLEHGRHPLGSPKPTRSCA